MKTKLVINLKFLDKNKIYGKVIKTTKTIYVII